MAKEPELVEVPRIERLKREEIEARLTIVRAKRLEATVVYHQGKNAKYEHQAAVFERRINQQLDMLEKELERLTSAEEKVQARLDNIEVLQHNAGLARDMIVVFDKDKEDE